MYLKLGFACDTKETVVQFYLWKVVVIAAFEPVGNWVKISLLCEARVLVFFSDSTLRKVMFVSSLFRSASIVIWYCLTDESASAFKSLAISLRAYFLNLIGFFVRSATVSHFFLGSFPINWVHTKFILRPLRRALVLVICPIHIFIVNSLNLFVSMKCIFTRLSTSNEEWSTNEVSCAEELNRILALFSLKMDPYPQTKMVRLMKQGYFHVWCGNINCATLVLTNWIWCKVLQWTYLAFYSPWPFLCLWSCSFRLFLCNLF